MSRPIGRIAANGGGFGERRFAASPDDCVDCSVEHGDPLQMGLDERAPGKLALAHEAHRFPGRPGA